MAMPGCRTVFPVSMAALLAAGAVAQPAPPTAVEIETSTRAPSWPASARLFRTLGRGGLDALTDRHLAAALTELDADCPEVERYQLVTDTQLYRSLKILCSDRELYVLTVAAAGRGSLSGGDGLVRPISSAEGPVRTRIERAVPRVSPEETRRERRETVRQTYLIAALVAAALAIAAAFYWEWRARLVAPWRRLDSREKDRLLTEAEEVMPDVFRHPAGMWIARGRRRKRRIFRNSLFALLYAKYGLKFFQVR